MHAKKREEWEGKSSEQVIEALLDRYHAELREAVPEIIELARKVEGVHGKSGDFPAGLTDALIHLWQKLEAHLTFEEKVVFPWIERDPTPGNSSLHAMMLEHNEQGELLFRIRELCRNYALPAHACGSWRALYHSLQELEAKLVEHIQLENNVLFERVIFHGGPLLRR